MFKMDNLYAVLAIFFLFQKHMIDASISGFYADDGLAQQTIIVNQMRRKDQKEMQHEILSLLGLNHRPHPMVHGKTKSAPKYMLDLYKTLSDTEGENDLSEMVMAQEERVVLNETMTHEEIQAIDGSDMIMSFPNHGEVLKQTRHEKNRLLYFDFSEVSPTEWLTSAELRLYKDSVQRSHPKKFSIKIYHMADSRNTGEHNLIHECTQDVRHDFSGWILLNVTNSATKWQRNPSSNIGLLMEVFNEKGHAINPHHIGFVGRKGAEEKQPFLVAFFKAVDTKVHLRQRRSTVVSRHIEDDDEAYSMDAPANNNKWNWAQPSKRKDKKHSSHKTCQRRTLYVSFRDLGWEDWIIAPEGYPAFYCFGQCSFPLNSHMNATNHAIVQTLVHLMNPHKVPQPCCAPTKLSAISVLYFDDNTNVILKKYRNMVVRSCGCH